jgi:hydroxypyruvate isomerase
MPRFAANLSFLFTERPFFERFAAAKAAGFAAVEFHFPYEFDRAALAEVVLTSGLEVVLFNLPAGDWAAGERGIACHPRRIAEFQDGVGPGHRVREACWAARASTAWPASRRARSADEKAHETLVENLRFAAAVTAPRRHRAGAGAAQHARHAGLPGQLPRDAGLAVLKPTSATTTCACNTTSITPR